MLAKFHLRSLYHDSHYAMNFYKRVYGNIPYNCVQLFALPFLVSFDGENTFLSWESWISLFCYEKKWMPHTFTFNFSYFYICNSVM